MAFAWQVLIEAFFSRLIRVITNIRPTASNDNAPFGFYLDSKSMINQSTHLDELRLERFRQLVKNYNISYDFAFRLRSLEGFDIVMIIDDSSSMRTPVIDREQMNVTPFDQLPTRWDELKQFVSIVIDLASVLGSDGVDVFFLNRPPLLHVMNASELNETFSFPPNGGTPLTQVLRYVLNLKRAQVNDRKVLILIATDGLPTDNQGQTDIASLENVLRYERYPSIERMHVTFLACTNDLQTVGYLNRLDRKIPYLDVLDDYRSERAEVLAAQGKNFSFTYGDYVVKMLLGSVDQWFDYLDERKVKLPWRDLEQRQTNVLGRRMRSLSRSCSIS